MWPFEHAEPSFNLVPTEPVEDDVEYQFPDPLPSPLPVKMGLGMLEVFLASMRDDHARQRSNLESMAQVLQDMQTGGHDDEHSVPDAQNESGPRLPSSSVAPGIAVH